MKKSNRLKKPLELFKISWNSLSPNQKFVRERSLEVLSIARKSKQSLSKIAKNHDISLKTVIKNTNAFRKVNRRWIPKKTDKIPRSMIINENGKRISIEINDSRYASVIGKYHNAVKEFLNTGNKKKLSEFSKITIKDSNKNEHFFETNPKKIIQIEERVEEREFVDVYDFEQ